MAENIAEPSLHHFTIADFRKSIETMIGTSEQAYKRPSSGRNLTSIRDYTEEEITRIVSQGTLDEKQTLSANYFLVDGIYRRIIIYYATLLKYSGILIPDVAQGHSIRENGISKKYNQALALLDRINVEDLCINYMTRALVYGSYYGVIQTIDKKNFAVIDLPPKYCISRYKDVQNNDIIEFNLQYFDTITEQQQKEAALNVYPDIFRQAYEAYHRHGGSQYLVIPSDIGICFPMYDGRPFFLPTISEIANYRAYEELEREKDSEEVKKILIQEIPHLSTGELLFEPDEVAEMHKGTVQMLKGNKSTSVITTYGEIDVKGTNTSTESVSKNNLEKIAQSVYRSSGVTSQLFAATSNMAISVSLENDLAFVMTMAKKFSVFLTNIVNRLCGSPVVTFKYEILPITYYNEKEYIDNAYKEATVGYSFFLPAIAMGINQKDLVNLKKVENDLLGLDKLLIPLNTAFNGGAQNSNETGRPEKSDTEKSEKTIRNIEEAGNDSN